MAMTYEQLLARIIEDGIAEVREVYTRPEEHHKRDGAIEGFEACRGKTPDELVKMWIAAEEACSLRYAEKLSNEEYWRLRYKALQIEWCLNVVSIGLNRSLLPHLPTYRAAVKYAQIVGVRGGEGEHAS